MPATLQVAQKATSTFKEWSQPLAGGVEVQPVGPVTFVSSAPTVATVDASGNVLAVAVGQATITATDTGNQLSASDTVSVVPNTVVAQSATLVVSPA